MFTYAPYQYDPHPFLIGVQAEFKVMGAGRSNSYRTCTLPPPLSDLAVETVSARELHSFLESKQDFSTWIKNRISEYDFIENQDFVKLHKKMELSKTGQMGIDYHITLDMAKELSMVERNEKGREARKYFKCKTYFNLL